MAAVSGLTAPPPPPAQPTNGLTVVSDGDEIEEAPDECCGVSPSETMTCDIMPTICEDPMAIAGESIFQSSVYSVTTMV